MKRKTGLLLMNLGSPDSTAVSDVRKYLSEFLMDERVIDIPYLARLLLVRGIIAPFRAPRSSKAYQSIWTNEGSPLIFLTKQLQEAVQKTMDAPIEIAMRYGNPTTEKAFSNLLDKEPELEEVIAMPLYPHYAMSSYETAVKFVEQTHVKGKYPFKIKFIKPYYNNVDYIHALSESIAPQLVEPYDHILFSYHGIPERHVRKTDFTRNHCLKVANCCTVDSPAHSQCYKHQCATTTKLVAQQLNIPVDKYSFSFQSRLGQDEWLKPYTVNRLKEMPKEGIKRLVIVCPAFVSDCLETLEEIEMEGKEDFLHAGGDNFTLIPCLNVHPLWVATIKKFAESVMAGESNMVLSEIH